MAVDPHPASVRVCLPVLKTLVWLLFSFFFAPIRVRGLRNVPRSGPLLIISNHISNTDPVVVHFASPRLVHFLARRDLTEMGLVGKFVRWFRIIPIKQSSADKGAIRSAVETLKDGRCVCIFPEGQLSPDGKLIEMLPGTALIVRMAGVPCICVGLQGSNRMMPHPSVVPRWAFAWVTAHWGQPRTFSSDASVEEIMGWAESELLALSGQEPRESALPA